MTKKEGKREGESSHPLTVVMESEGHQQDGEGDKNAVSVAANVEIRLGSGRPDDDEGEKHQEDVNDRQERERARELEGVQVAVKRKRVEEDAAGDDDHNLRTAKDLPCRGRATRARAVARGVDGGLDQVG